MDFNPSNLEEEPNEDDYVGQKYLNELNSSLNKQFTEIGNNQIILVDLNGNHWINMKICETP